MIYTDLTKKAMKIAFKAHSGQLDKAGIPYINHPLHLAEQMDDEASTCVALLHDTIEDSNGIVTIESLMNDCFPLRIIEAVRLLTHDENIAYMDYVAKLSHNQLARKVKIADLKHNLDTTRLPKGKANKKQDLYKKALDYLTSLG